MPDAELERLLNDRMQNFWGYGNPSGPIWFIGLEEGFHCEYPAEALRTRFRATQAKSFVDIQDDMRIVEDHISWFQRGGPRHGPTPHGKSIC